MSDRIFLDRLAVFAHHGVFPEEERLGQKFVISVVCHLDLAPAGRNDDYEQSVCYGQLAEMVHRISTGQRFRIIEGLAEAIAAAVLEQHSRVEAVTVKVEKPGAPIPFVLDGVAVEIERRRI